MIVTTYNQHVRLLSSEPFGWFAPPKSTRAWEPTLLWNHYTNNQVVSVIAWLRQLGTTMRLPRIPRRHTITSEEPGVNKFAFILCVAMAWFVVAPRAQGS